MAAVMALVDLIQDTELSRISLSFVLSLNRKGSRLWVQDLELEYMVPSVLLAKNA
jgi:hypothetical protein